MGGLSHTVSGDIASFRTPSRVPIESLKFHFLPKQAAGTPSPENIIPIEGWTGLNGRRAHKNIIKPRHTIQEIKNGLTITPTSNGIKVKGTASARTACFLAGTDVLSLDLGKKYTFSLYLNGDISECENPFLGYYTSPNVFGAVIGQLNTTNEYVKQWIVPSGYANASAPHIDAYIYVPSGITVDFEIGLQMEVGENATSYEPYSEELIPLTFPSTRNLLDTSTHETDTHIVKKGITFDYNMDGSLTVNGIVDSDASSGPQYRMATWTQQETGNFYLCCLAPFSTTYNEAYVYDNDLSERPKKWDGETQSQSAGSNRTLVEVRLIAGHTYAVNVRINRGYDKTYANNKFYVMILRSTDTNTNYEPYGVFYGGYIDPIRGKLVRTYAIGILDGTESVYTISGGQGYRFGVQRGYTSMKGDFNKPILNASTIVNPSIRSNRFLTKTANSLYGGEIGIAFGGDGSTIWMCYGETGMTEEKIRSFLSANPVQLAYELATPVEYDITPTEIKAFLDHNNFWSDANDITEVTYAITESKDILATRKKAMAFDHAHHKKIKWNQISLDGNFQDADYRNWQWNANFGAFQIQDGVATWTANQSPSVYYATGFTRKVNYLLIPYNHKILVSAKMRTSAHYSTLQFRIYGMVTSTGGTHTYFYRDNVQAADTWQTVRGFISDRPEIPPSGFDDVIIKKFKPLLCKNDHGSYEGIIDDGTTMDVKELMAFDLTQMFGLGNEPQTVAEFEHICEINGIDLTTYQPYDEGSDRWLIVP